MTSKDISYNFSVAKVLSILMVATGHYFSDTFLWLPTTVALFIFAFSSGYFTSIKYNYGFSIAKFWDAKFVRLSYRLLVINTFLLMLFLVQKKSGILTWHTLTAMLGLSGFLNWFKITNQSPFGAGLWFFTVLWMFYLVYPVIAYINQYKKLAIFYVTCSFVLSIVLTYTVRVGHELWYTIFAFIFGVYIGKFNFTLPTLLLMAIWVICIVGILGLNLYGNISILNSFIIIIISIVTVLLLLQIKLPEFAFNKALKLSDCVMEIYFIHSYLLIHNSKHPIYLDFLISLLVIICFSFALNILSNQLKISKNMKIVKENMVN